jgi:hypothetical protein
MTMSFLNYKIFLTMLVVSVMTWSSPHDVPDEITIGVIPGGSPEAIKKQGIELKEEAR